MPFAKIESALATCKSHLDTIDDADPKKVEIEAYIVAGLILLIVSEYEALIESIFCARADQARDSHVTNYIRVAIAQKFRSPDISKVTGALNQFGGDYKQNFSNKIIDTEAHAAWDNIIQARHTIVHKNNRTVYITLKELIKTYPKTKKVLAELRSTLGIP